MTYFSRHCYDKPHRCPGWAGGGWRYPKVDRCENGRLRIANEEHADPWMSFRWHRCSSCDVIAIPEVVRWLDPTWWTWWLGSRIGNVAYEWRWWRRQPLRFLRYRYRTARIHWHFRLHNLWAWYRPGSRPIRRAAARWRRHGETQ